MSFKSISDEVDLRSLEVDHFIKIYFSLEIEIRIAKKNLSTGVAYLASFALGCSPFVFDVLVVLDERGGVLVGKVFAVNIFVWSINMRSTVTADLCDTNQHLIKTGEVRVLDPIFKIYGNNQSFSGTVVPLKVSDENAFVREILETKGEGRVLVLDGGGSKRCALFGGTLAQLAHDMGWAGIIVNGCIRDVSEINITDIGVRAIGSNPLKPNKWGTGEKNVPVSVGGALIFPGEWLYADSDGVIVSKNKLTI